MDYLKDKKIVIIGALRNNEVYLESVLKNIYNIAHLFGHYKIVLYENHSKDNTINILKSYMEKDKDFE